MTEVVLPTDERLRALAEEVLAGSEYADYRGRPTELQEFIARLADWLERTLGWLPDRIESNWEYIKNLLLGWVEGALADDPLGILLRFVLAAAVLSAVVVMFVAIGRALRGRLGDAGSSEAGTASSSPHALLEEAEALAGGGRFLEAAHCTQLATLELLLRREWISLERSDPNRTLRRRIEAGGFPGAERSEFLALLDRLESRWFRDRTEDQDLYGAWLGLHARLAAQPANGAAAR